jgi:hypothetical protein
MLVLGIPANVVEQVRELAKKMAGILKRALLNHYGEKGYLVS